MINSFQPKVTCSDDDLNYKHPNIIDNSEEQSDIQEIDIRVSVDT